MPESRKHNVVMRNNSGQENPGVLHTTLYDQSEAFQRASKMAGLFILLAFVTLFIPLAHFILVPSFLIAAVVVPRLIYKIREASERVQGVCPSCGKEVSIKLDANDRLPLWRYCPDCDNSLQLLMPESEALDHSKAADA